MDNWHLSARAAATAAVTAATTDDDGGNGSGDCGDGAGDDGGTTTATAAMAKAAAVATTLDSCHLHCFRKSNDALKQLPRYMEICQDGNGLVGQLRTCVFLLCFFGDYFTASGNLQITFRTLWHRSGDPTSRFGVYLTYQKLNNEGATTEEETIDRARYDRRDKVQRRLDRYFTVVSMLRSEKLELHFRLSPRIEAFFNSPHRRSKPPQKLVH